MKLRCGKCGKLVDQDEEERDKLIRDFPEIKKYPNVCIGCLEAVGRVRR